MHDQGPAAASLFASFFLGGFECSTHRRHDGERLDLIAATGHDTFAQADYLALRRHGIRTVRDGLRWHLIEIAPGRYDWSSFLPMLRAARQAGVQVIWDLCHYGWPDDIHIWTPAFVDRFARFAEAAARVIRDETGEVPFYCPVNEISFWAWAGGEVARFNPLERGQGGRLKRQLVQAAIAGIDAVRAVDPRARIVLVDPVIHVASGSERASSRQAAESYRLAQFEAWDMLSGRIAPELGGRPEYLDIVGVNYYSDNQWYLGGATIPLGHHAYRPFHEILREVHRRYARPILIAETGAEASARAAWLYYVAAETRIAVEAGVPVEGICIYPIMDYPGWADRRPCAVGLFAGPKGPDRLAVHSALADELRRQTTLFEDFFAAPKLEADAAE